MTLLSFRVAEEKMQANSNIHSFLVVTSVETEKNEKQ